MQSLKLKSKNFVSKLKKLLTLNPEPSKEDKWNQRNEQKETHKIENENHKKSQMSLKKFEF